MKVRRKAQTRMTYWPFAPRLVGRVRKGWDIRKASYGAMWIELKNGRTREIWGLDSTVPEEIYIECWGADPDTLGVIPIEDSIQFKDVKNWQYMVDYQETRKKHFEWIKANYGRFVPDRRKERRMCRRLKKDW